MLTHRCVAFFWQLLFFFFWLFFLQWSPQHVVHLTLPHGLQLTAAHFPPTPCLWWWSSPVLFHTPWAWNWYKTNVDMWPIVTDSTLHCFFYNKKNRQYNGLYLIKTFSMIMAKYSLKRSHGSPPFMLEFLTKIIYSGGADQIKANISTHKHEIKPSNTKAMNKTIKTQKMTDVIYPLCPFAPCWCTMSSPAEHEAAANTSEIWAHSTAPAWMFLLFWCYFLWDCGMRSCRVFMTTKKISFITICHQFELLPS